MYKLIELFNQSNFCPLLTFISSYQKWSFKGFFAFSKTALSRIFCFIALSKMAFISLYQKQLFLLYHFIALSKTAFICLYQKQSFSLYHFTALSKTAFIGLYLNCLY